MNPHGHPSNCKVVIVKHDGDDCDCPVEGIDMKHLMHHLHQSGCCSPHIQRQFVSTGEKIEHLEEYRDSLEKELAGVKEAIENQKDE